MYGECNFQGCYATVCDGDNEDLVNPLLVKSVYVPEGKVVTVYDTTNFVGRKKKFYKTTECINAGQLTNFMYLRNSHHIHNSHGHLTKNKWFHMHIIYK